MLYIFIYITIFIRIFDWNDIWMYNQFSQYIIWIYYQKDQKFYFLTIKLLKFLFVTLLKRNESINKKKRNYEKFVVSFKFDYVFLRNITNVLLLLFI